ncbi:hypothetical protein PRIPAC_74021 [Pristionchus pacificus]|uniref:Uncharacterized protein n=1 Tax=Pristionchus pacificus TaxID=54126 RepID=A0A454Y260_PRIPA|nr:hypothetical protein PRIPAC_74021 [Pristionchus pacificus]|eukprot:PDM83726.1 hypothetical protein PRIPAC_30213 [Pristionchus pacificus]
MKWVLAAALIGLAIAAQQAQPNKTTEGATQSADGRRSHRRHRESSESFEEEDVYAAHFYAAPTPKYRPPPPYAHLPANSDVNYCSIHASFPMAGGYEDDSRDESDLSDVYGRRSPRRSRSLRGRRLPRRHGYRHRWNRQTCRFTATFSQETCQSCCRVASRSNDADPAAITGSLFFFAPWDNESREKSPLRREIQCVCCSPRRVVSATLPPTPSYGEREDYGEKEEEN